MLERAPECLATLQPTAPAVATQNRFSWPLCTRLPAKVMITSEGKGMHADSIAINNTTPQ